ncbi:MAG: hypothetical protein WDN02_13185 [Methylovirgula sp.]|uniref:hypothetical protein n=1 Tax=Methylovirgula sp. TaxID=1978224 RepID=UPI00307686DE
MKDSSDGTHASWRSRHMTLAAATAIAAITAASFASPARADSANEKRLEAKLDALMGEVSELKREMHVEKRHTQHEFEHVRMAANEPVFAGPVVKGPEPYVPPQPWDKRFHLFGITLTPGGFIEAGGVWRSRGDSTGIDTNWNAIPMGNSPLAHTNEFRFDARQSRFSLLAQGNVNPALLISGYSEFDFLAAAGTANQIDSNSYTPRIRNLYVTLDWRDTGWSVLGGQSWTLATTNGKGIQPRTEIFAPFIDGNFIPGSVWTRQPGLRVTKNFGDFTAAVSAEQPETTFAPACPGIGGYGAIGNGVSVYCQQAGSHFFNTATNYSLNRVPDAIAKVAWDPTFGDRAMHFEAFGLYTDLYDRVEYPGGNFTSRDTTGWGAGGSVVVSVLPKWVDFEANVMTGRGIGRYGVSTLPTATFNADGSLSPIPETIALGFLTLHATPQIDLWAAAGIEHEYGDYFSGGTVNGPGSPLANNTGCNTETAAASTCNGITKDIWQLTGGVWDRVYQGDFGSVRVGVQYSYTQRELFAGSGGLPAGSAPLGAKTTDNILLTSLRYYPFQ